MLPALRVLALLAASALLGQHAAELVHSLTVQHVRCAEHGDLIDSSAPQAKPNADFSIDPAEQAGGAEHEHCAVEWLAHSQAAAGSPSIAAIRLEVSVERAALPPSITPVRLLLRVAPKTSPPLFS